MKWTFTIAFLILLFCGYHSFSQSSAVQAIIDSSQKRINDKNVARNLAEKARQTAKSENDFTAEFAALKNLGRIEEYHLKLDSALYYYKLAHELALSKNKTGSIIDILLEFAYVQEQQGQRDTALASAKKSLQLAKKNKDENRIFSAHQHLGYFYLNGGNHEKSISHYLQSLTLAEKLQNPKKIAKASQGIGIIYNKQMDFDRAEKYFTQSLNYQKQLKDTAGIIRLSNDFGILNKNKKNYQEAEKWFLEILELSKNGQYTWAHQSAYNNLGLLYYQMNLYQRGIAFSQKGVDEFAKNNNKRALSDALNNLSKNELALGRTQSAINHALQSLQLAREIKTLEKQREALKVLAQAHENQGKTGTALTYYKEYKALYDSIYTIQKSAQIHGLEKKFNSAKKDKEIALLAKDAELARTRSSWILIGLGLVLFFGGLLFWKQIQNRKKEKLIEKEKRKVSELETARLKRELSFKKQELTSKVLQLCRKNEFMQTLDEKVKAINQEVKSTDKKQLEKLSRQINQDIDADADWEQFLQSFESVHTTFMKTVNQTYPNFSKGEIRMACLLKMNLSTKDIANLLNITVAGVKKSRNRMRKKMEIESSDNLTTHFLNLD